MSGPKKKRTLWNSNFMGSLLDTLLSIDTSWVLFDKYELNQD